MLELMFEGSVCGQRYFMNYLKQFNQKKIIDKKEEIVSGPVLPYSLSGN